MTFSLKVEVTADSGTPDTHTLELGGRCQVNLSCSC